MTSNALTLSDQMAYAQAVVHNPQGTASLLPKAYQGNPSAVLIAMGLGDAIGLTPAQALYEVYVVNGRPSPSANLMAALVRRAGHKLRIDGDATRCTATLIRHDDPEAPFAATWTIEQARAAGLTGKDTWKAYPAAMLRARAIAEVVRMGASEAVLGMDYAKEEMQDVEPDRPAVAASATGLAAVRAAVGQEPAPVDVTDAEVVEDEPITAQQMKALHASFNDAGITDRDQRLDYCRNLTGWLMLDSSKDLTRDEASMILDALKADAAGQDTGAEA